MEAVKSILDSKVHARLIADMDHICETANVQEKYVHQSMIGGVSSADDIEWVRHFREYRAKGLAGVAMVGVENVHERQMAMAGALLRNFVDARVIPVNQALALLKKDSMPEPTVLLVPNFFIKPVGKGSMFFPEQIQRLYDLMVARWAANKPTVIYVEDKLALRQTYGAAIADLIDSQYKIIGE